MVYVLSYDALIGQKDTNMMVFEFKVCITHSDTGHTHVKAFVVCNTTQEAYENMHTRACHMIANEHIISYSYALYE